MKQNVVKKGNGEIPRQDAMEHALDGHIAILRKDVSSLNQGL